VQQNLHPADGDIERRWELSRGLPTLRMQGSLAGMPGTGWRNKKKKKKAKIFL